MIRNIILISCVVIVAACTTSPAMTPSHIASLHSGRMIVTAPNPGHLPSSHMAASVAGVALEAAAGALFGGGMLGTVIIGNQAGQSGLHAAKMKVLNAVLRPYSDTLVNLYPTHEFLGISRSVADHVHWMGKNPMVRMYANAEGPDSAEKSHLAQVASTQATVFVDYTFGFGVNLKSLSVKAHVQVYARGAHRGDIIDGTNLGASVQLMSLTPPLKAYGFEAIAASKRNDRAALGARANVWFENGGARYKTAVARDMAELRSELVNYLNGRRGSG